MGNKSLKVDSLSNEVSEDLDFNIEEVEQVIAPQIDNGGVDDGSGKIDEPEIKGNVSCSRKLWCC